MDEAYNKHSLAYTPKELGITFLRIKMEHLRGEDIVVQRTFKSGVGDSKVCRTSKLQLCGYSNINRVTWSLKRVSGSDAYIMKGLKLTGTGSRELRYISNHGSEI